MARRSLDALMNAWWREKAPPESGPIDKGHHADSSAEEIQIIGLGLQYLRGQGGEFCGLP